MVLNPQLYRLLTREYGQVKLINAGHHRVEARAGDKYVVEDRGEHYSVCCPVCGDDRFRLSVSYRWLSTGGTVHRNKTLAHCYNEDCGVTEPEFVDPLIEKLEALELGLDPGDDIPVPTLDDVLPKNALRLPTGLIPVQDLPPDHEAWSFLETKYPRLPRELFVEAGAAFAGSRDPVCPSAYRRVIFPISYEQEVVAWQGRSIDPAASMRWFLPPGFQKTLYNYDRVSPIDVPILCEGITSSLATSPNALALFGSSITNKLLNQLKSKWSSVLIATDPDTFVQDYRNNRKGLVVVDTLRTFLEPHLRVRLLQWPEVVLEVARRHNNGALVKVPDAADFGPAFMSKLVGKSL